MDLTGVILTVSKQYHSQSVHWCDFGPRFCSMTKCRETCVVCITLTKHKIVASMLKCFISVQADTSTEVPEVSGNLPSPGKSKLSMDYF